MRTPFVLALLWCSLGFADRFPELDAGRFGMLSRVATQPRAKRTPRALVGVCSELDLIRESGPRLCLLPGKIALKRAAW